MDNKSISRSHENDTISKEMARRIIDSTRNKKQMLRMLESIPAAEPKRGKWIEGNHANYWKCSECGEVTMESVMGKPRHNFCPNCGADMRGEQNAER